MLTETDFTLSFCTKLLDEHGDARTAAKAISAQCWSLRYGRPVSANTVRLWMGRHLAPRRRKRKEQSTHQSPRVLTGAFLSTESAFPDRKDDYTDWREIARAAAEEAERRVQTEPFQKTATVDLSGATKPVCIMLLSDIHIGSPQCDYATFLRHADLLAKHDNLYAIVLGDVVEWAISQRMMSSVLEQVMPPAVQARFWKAFVSDLLKKLVAVVMGNHEGRSERYGGFDVGEYLYHELTNGAAPYLKDGGSLRILVGEQEYSGLLMHGDGIPGNSMYSKTAKHQRLQRHQWGWHDFACIGHTHEAEVLVTEVPTDDAGGRREVHQLQAGSYKVLHSEQYPHRMGFMGSPIVDMPAIVLWPDQKRMASFRRVESALAALEGWK